MGIFINDELWKTLSKELKELQPIDSFFILQGLLGYMEVSIKTNRDGYCAFAEGLQSMIIAYKGVSKDVK